jgi:uncharacterized delta-60 repeat protein
MHLLEPIGSWTSFMFEPLEARLLLAANLPTLDDFAFVRDGGNGRIVVADSDYDERSAFVLRLAPDGALDPTFGRGGVVRIAGAAIVTDLEVRPDGKALILADLTDGRVAVFRLSADGTPDRTFGVGGRALLPYGPIGYWRIASGTMTLDNDGRIVVAEAAAEVNDRGDPNGLYVSRLMPDGRTDATFGVGGVTLLHSPLPLAEMDAIYVRPDGAIDVSVPPLGYPGGVFARLRPDGSADLSFGDGGVLVRDLDGSFYDWHALADGRTLAYDHAADPNGPAPRLHAYDRDGRADPSFGVGGIAQFVGINNVPVTAPAIRSGDRTILALFASNPIFGNIELIAIRDDGSIDTAWGFEGRQILADDAGSQGDFFINLAIADNGDLLAAHVAYDTENYEPRQLVIDRFRPDGAPEYNFGLGGEVAFDLAPPGELQPGPIDPPAPDDPAAGDDAQGALEVPTHDPQSDPSQAGAPPRGSSFSLRPIDEGAAAVLLLGTAAERSLFGDRPDDLFEG